MDEQPTAGPVLSAIRSRRVTRAFTRRLVDDGLLHLILDAARWAPSGGNRRLNRFVVVRSPLRLRLLRAVSPGLLGEPPVVIVICVDFGQLEAIGTDDSRQNSSYVDVGTAAQSMLLAAHELGLGACPVMSFHRGAVRVLLELPTTLCPVLMLALGYAQPAQQGAGPRSRLRLPTLAELTYWETYPAREATRG
jgi:nitroreductase